MVDTSKMTYVGSVDVDSGLLLLTDPCYALGDKFVDTDRYVPYEDLRDGTVQPSGIYDYMGAEEAAWSPVLAGGLNHEGGHGGAGVSVSPGYGDGTYGVYVEYVEGEAFGLKGKRVASMTVVFISDGEDVDHD